MYKKCLSYWYAVSKAYGCTLIPLHRPSWPQIWGFRFTWGVEMMPQHHGWGWYLPQTTSYIHIGRIKSVWAIGMLSQGHMGAFFFRYTDQVAPRFGKSGSLEEWKWWHILLFEADIHLRLLHTSIYTYTMCLRHWYAVSRAYGCTLIPWHRPSWPQIWGFKFTWGVEMMPQRLVWGWYSPQTASYIHIRHIQSVWLIGMLSQGHLVAPKPLERRAGNYQLLASQQGQRRIQYQPWSV